MLEEELQEEQITPLMELVLQQVRKLLEQHLGVDSLIQITIMQAEEVGYFGGYAGYAVPAGGGSGYIGGVTNGSTSAGQRSGNGYATITLVE